jgi:hypothetical protein
MRTGRLQLAWLAVAMLSGALLALSALSITTWTPSQDAVHQQVHTR